MIDTGARAETVLKNAEELRVDLSTITLSYSFYPQREPQRPVADNAPAGKPGRADLLGRRKGVSHRYVSWGRRRGIRKYRPHRRRCRPI